MYSDIIAIIGYIEQGGGDIKSISVRELHIGPQGEVYKILPASRKFGPHEAICSGINCRIDSWDNIKQIKLLDHEWQFLKMCQQ